MSETITGMNLYANDAKGKKVERFQVKWIGQLAFGVANENTTDREFLELHSRENDNLTKQRDALLALLTEKAETVVAGNILQPDIDYIAIPKSIAEKAIATAQPSKQSVKE